MHSHTGKQRQMFLNSFRGFTGVGLLPPKFPLVALRLQAKGHIFLARGPTSFESFVCWLWLDWDETLDCVLGFWGALGFHPTSLRFCDHYRCRGAF